MKINGRLPDVARVYNQQQNFKNQKKEEVTEGSSDWAEISNDGRELRELLQKAKGIPEVRDELVAKLKAAMDNGTYLVNSSQLAERIIQAVKDENNG